MTDDPERTVKSEATTAQTSSHVPTWLVRYLSRHITVYGCVLIALLLLHAFSPADRGVFWPMMVWTIIVLLHIIFARALSIKEEWVDERSSRIIENASDLSHIQSIRERYEARMTKKPGSQSDDDAKRGG